MKRSLLILVTSKSTTIKVLCVDDNADITRLLSVAIAAEPDMDVVGELHTTENLLEELVAREPDVVLLDLSMPGGNVLQWLGRIRTDLPDTRVVVFSGFDDHQRMDAALEAGAWGYIAKSVDLTVLMDGIRDVAQGKIVSLR